MGKSSRCFLLDALFHALLHAQQSQVFTMACCELIFTARSRHPARYRFG